MSWELISSIMVITLPADYLAAMALPQGFPWVLQQLIFSVAGAPELEQHGRQLLCNRLEEGRKTGWEEGGRGKTSLVKDLLPSPSPALGLFLCLWLSRLVLPGWALGMPRWVMGWVGYLGHLPQASVPSWAKHMATCTPGLFPHILLQGGGAGSDLSKNKCPGGSGERLELPCEGQEQADPGDSAGCFEELMLHEKGTIGAPGAL